jgi:tetratricopeptide (TPR) repeat protein
MLTIQILVKNNENTIKETLDSIISIKSKIIVVDLGCSDATLDICNSYNTHIIKSDGDRSKIRNSVSGEGLNFYINPWEKLIQGHEIIESITDCSEVYLFQNNIISREIRFWTNQKFINPVFETIINKESKFYPQIIISSKNKPNDSRDNLKLVEKWMNNRPIDLEPYYYLACCYLSMQNYEKFLFFAKEYCSREKKINSSFIMTKYYMSQINLYLGKIKESAESALTCISYQPSMAEFWCLLGDIYYKQKAWKKSKCFYENALIIGQKRIDNDLPIEIVKYKEYPEKMIKNVEEIEKKSSLY